MSRMIVCLLLMMGAVMVGPMVAITEPMRYVLPRAFNQSEPILVYGAAVLTLPMQRTTAEWGPFETAVSTHGHTRR